MSLNTNMLIGAQLVSFDDYGFTVKKGEETYVFEYETDYGGCCGFTQIDTDLCVDLNDPSNNPVITKVELDPYCDDGDGLIITLFGLYKPLAIANVYASSGSGWEYGASVSLHCVQTDETTTLVQY